MTLPALKAHVLYRDASGAHRCIVYGRGPPSADFPHGHVDLQREVDGILLRYVPEELVTEIGGNVVAMERK